MCGQPFALLLFLLLSLISPIKRKSIPQFSPDKKPVFFLISSFQEEVGTTGLEESHGRTMLLKCALQYLPLMRLVWGENFKRSSADGSLSYIPRFFFSNVVHITADLRRWQLLDRRPLHTDNLDRQYWRCAGQPWQNRLSLPWWVAGLIYLSHVLAGPILILPGEWQFYSCLLRIRLKIWCNSLCALPGITLQCSALGRSYP